MEEIDIRRIYQEALAVYGIRNQVLMVMEETGEMLNALAKFNRKRSTQQDIITELADVSIMVEQMAEWFGWEEFKKEKERKIHRLKRSLEA